jgi:hypothetical protein
MPDWGALANAANQSNAVLSNYFAERQRKKELRDELRRQAQIDSFNRMTQGRAFQAKQDEFRADEDWRTAQLEQGNRDYELNRMNVESQIQDRAMPRDFAPKSYNFDQDMMSIARMAPDQLSNLSPETMTSFKNWQANLAPKSGGGLSADESWKRAEWTYKNALGDAPASLKRVQEEISKLEAVSPPQMLRKMPIYENLKRQEMQLELEVVKVKQRWPGGVPAMADSTSAGFQTGGGQSQTGGLSEEDWLDMMADKAVDSLFNAR